MAIQNDNTVLCKGDLKAYHEKILPYLGGNFMLGTNVSDYYSTDEKIVGVWIDGRPLYQKTIYIPSVAINSTYYLTNYINDIANVDYMFKVAATINRTTANVVLNEFWNATNDFFICSVNYHSEIGWHSKIAGVSSWTDIKDFKLTVCYTRTTDAANSAVTTPGCYDLNRPDLWPANNEIFFGNGLYGYRETGTITQAASQLNMKTLNPTNITKLTNCGGQWYHGSEYISLNGCNQDYQKSGLVLSGNRLSLRTYSNQARSNAPYDIWFTYLK